MIPLLDGSDEDNIIVEDGEDNVIVDDGKDDCLSNISEPDRLAFLTYCASMVMKARTNKMIRVLNQTGVDTKEIEKILWHHLKKIMEKLPNPANPG